MFSMTMLNMATIMEDICNDWDYIDIIIKFIFYCHVSILYAFKKFI